MNGYSNGGTSPDGGGMHVDNGATVALAMCSFENNYSSDDGGGLYVDTSPVDVFANSFSGNTAPYGNDVFKNSGDVTIHETCGFGFAGTGTQGTDLHNGAITESGSISGPREFVAALWRD
jgi:predicted outer membrane repeat protein